jgi:hypothetical protein
VLIGISLMKNGKNGISLINIIQNTEKLILYQCFSSEENLF